MKRLTVFAMTKKGYAVVASIHSRYPGMIRAVIGSRDAGMAEDYYENLKQFCVAGGIDFYDRRDAPPVKTEYALAVSWRWVIGANASRLIVFHDSLLPRHRGFNPLVTALIAGDTEIGVTALFASEEYDRGDIIARSGQSVQYPITIREAIDAVLGNYESLAAEIAGHLDRGEPLAGTPQTEENASYSLWRDDEDYFIDWAAPAAAIERFVDAVGFPYKSSASMLDGKVVRLLKAKALEDVRIENRVPGKILFIQDSKPVVVCGKGLLRIEEIVDEAGSSILPLPRFRMRFKRP